MLWVQTNTLILPSPFDNHWFISRVVEVIYLENNGNANDTVGHVVRTLLIRVMSLLQFALCY